MGSRLKKMLRHTSRRHHVGGGARSDALSRGKGSNRATCELASLAQLDDWL